jgi:hypothetical protein
MTRKIWLARLMGVGLAVALCSWATAARAGNDEGDGEAFAAPELDSRAAGLSLAVLGGSLFVLHGRRKRGARGAL